MVPVSTSLPDSVAQPSAPPTLTLKLVSSSPHMPLVLFKLLSICWSSDCLSLCTVPLRPVAPQSLAALRLSHPVPAGFYSQLLWGLFFPALLSQDGELSIGLGIPAPQEVNPQQLCPSWFLTATPWVWDLPVHVSPPLTNHDVAFLYI